MIGFNPTYFGKTDLEIYDIVGSGDISHIRAWLRENRDHRHYDAVYAYANSETEQYNAQKNFY